MKQQIWNKKNNNEITNRNEIDKMKPHIHTVTYVHRREF